MPISFTWPHSAQSSHVYVAIANEKDFKNSEAWVRHKLQYEIEAAKFCITMEIPSGVDYLYYFVVDGSKRYDFEQDNMTPVFIDSDEMIIVNTITIPRETVRVGVADDSVCWSDSSSSSWTNEVEMQFMSPMMPKNFTPK